MEQVQQTVCVGFKPLFQRLKIKKYRVPMAMPWAAHGSGRWPSIPNGYPGSKPEYPILRASPQSPLSRRWAYRAGRVL